MEITIADARRLLDMIHRNEILMQKLITVIGSAKDCDLAFLGRQIEQATRREQAVREA